MSKYLIDGKYVDEETYRKHRQKQQEDKAKAAEKVDTPKTPTGKDSK